MKRHKCRAPAGLRFGGSGMAKIIWPEKSQTARAALFATTVTKQFQQTKRQQIGEYKHNQVTRGVGLAQHSPDAPAHHHDERNEEQDLKHEPGIHI